MTRLGERRRIALPLFTEGAAVTDHDPAECGVMIDAEDTADRDDAIWIQPAGTGFDAWVHIARVADHVQRGKSADVEARRRMYTRYRRDHTRRMLPLPVEQAATLRPGTEPQDTFAIRLRVEADGRARAVDLGPARLTRAWAMSHAEAAAAAKHPDHPLHAALDTALRVAQAMLSARRATGALALYDLRSGFATDEEGRLVRLEAAERNSGYVIVQEFMIAANAQIAAWAAERDLPILFRNHRLAAVAGDPSALREELDTVAAERDHHVVSLLRGLAAVDVRKAEVDHGDVGVEFLAHAGCYAARGHAAHDLEPLVTPEEEDERLAVDVVVLDEQHANRPCRAHSATTSSG
jgi:ribonuclease R